MAFKVLDVEARNLVPIMCIKEISSEGKNVVMSSNFAVSSWWGLQNQEQVEVFEQLYKFIIKVIDIILYNISISDPFHFVLDV